MVEVKQMHLMHFMHLVQFMQLWFSVNFRVRPCRVVDASDGLCI
jgi:hypothetical protein